MTNLTARWLCSRLESSLMKNLTAILKKTVSPDGFTQGEKALKETVSPDGSTQGEKAVKGTVAPDGSTQGEKDI